MKRILIVENNQLVAEMYRNKLQAEGFHVEVASDGEVGLELINCIKADLVLLGVTLPNLDGVEFLRRVREQALFQSLPVFVLSSSYLNDETWQAGATEVLSKAHHTPRQVVDKVKSALAAASVPQPASMISLPMPPALALMPVVRPAASSDLNVKSQTELRKTPLDGARETPQISDRILVAHSDLATLGLVTALVEQEGHEVVSARDGREALDILQRDTNFAAAIFDVGTLHIAGPELVHYMKMAKRLAHIPIMMITTNQNLKLSSDSFAAGAAVFLPKPFLTVQLPIMLRMLISKGNARKIVRQVQSKAAIAS